MPKSAETIRTEIVKWLEGNASLYRRQAMLGERKQAKALATAKSDAYHHAAATVAQWELGDNDTE